METIENQKVIPLREYAKKKNVSRQTIYNWIRLKKIVAKKIGYQQFIVVSE